MELARLLRQRGEEPIAINCDALQVYEGLDVLTGAASAAELDALRDAFRRGIPDRRDRGAQDEARRLYQLLASLGGAALVGANQKLPEGIFLDDLDG